MSGKNRAFALIGDRSHNSDYIRTALCKTLVQGAGLDIEFTDQVERLNADTLRGRRLLILFRDAALWPDGYGPGHLWPGGHHRRRDMHPFEIVTSSWYPGYEELTPIAPTSEPPVPACAAEPVSWMTDEQGRAVRSFVGEGGAALLYHNVTYIAKENAAFRVVLGAATQGHPPIRPFKVRITNADHPITRGVSDFVVTDEQHFLTYDLDPANVFMQSVNEDGLPHEKYGTACEAGWAREFGRGRVCYLAPGHTIPALWNPEYVKIQQNAARWLLEDDKK